MFWLEEVYTCLQCNVFSIVNMYLDHLKFCVACINGRRYVCCSECYDEWEEPTPYCCNLSVRTVVKLCTFGDFCYKGELHFLKFDDICMCVVNT